MSLEVGRHTVGRFSHSVRIVMKAFISRQGPLVAIVSVTGVTLWLMIDALRAALIITTAR